MKSHLATKHLLMNRVHGNDLKDEGMEVLVNGLIDLHEKRKPSEAEMVAIRSTAKTIISEVMREAMQSASFDSVESKNSSDSTQASLPEGDMGLMLKQLDLGDCMITGNGAEHIAKLISANTNISVLTLTGNRHISTRGWQSIGNALKSNDKIEVISLDYLNLGDSGTVVLCEGLKNNRSVTSIDLEGNKIGDDGAEAVLDLLSHNNSIREITLSPGNNISNENLQKIKQELKQRILKK